MVAREAVSSHFDLIEYAAAEGSEISKKANNPDRVRAAHLPCEKEISLLKILIQLTSVLVHPKFVVSFSLTFCLCRVVFVVVYTMYFNLLSTLTLVTLRIRKFRLFCFILIYCYCVCRKNRVCSSIIASSLNNNEMDVDLITSVFSVFSMLSQSVLPSKLSDVDTLSVQNYFNIIFLISFKSETYPTSNSN